MTEQEQRGVEQTVARLANLQEVAGSTPAPATTMERPGGEAVKRGPGRPRKVQPEAPASSDETDELLISMQNAQKAISIAAQPPPPPVPERLFSCTVQKPAMVKDHVTACIQVVAGGPIYRIGGNLLMAAEALPAGVELEPVPAMPLLLRVRRP